MKKILALLFSSVLLSGCVLDATGTGPSEPVYEDPVEDNSGGMGDEDGNYHGGHEPVFGCWGGVTYLEVEMPDGSISIIEIPAFCDPYWSIKPPEDKASEKDDIENPLDNIDELIVESF